MILPAVATPAILAPTGVSASVSVAPGGESAGDFGGTLAALLDGVAPAGPAPSAMLVDIAGRQPIAAPGKRLPVPDMPSPEMPSPGMLVEMVVPEPRPDTPAPRDGPGDAAPPIWSPQTAPAGAPMAAPTPVAGTVTAQAPGAMLATPRPMASSPGVPDPVQAPAQPNAVTAIPTGVIATNPIAADSLVTPMLVGAAADGPPAPVPIPDPMVAAARPPGAPDRLVRAPRSNDRPPPSKSTFADDEASVESDTMKDVPAQANAPSALPIALVSPLPAESAPIVPAVVPPVAAIIGDTGRPAPSEQTLPIATGRPQPSPVPPPPPRITTDMASMLPDAGATGTRRSETQDRETPPASPVPEAKLAPATMGTPAPATEIPPAPVATIPMVAIPVVHESHDATKPQTGVARVRSADLSRETGAGLARETGAGLARETGAGLALETGTGLPRTIPARVDTRAPAIPFVSGLDVVSIVEPAERSRLDGAARVSTPTLPPVQAPAYSLPLAAAHATDAAANALPPRWSAQEATPVMTLVAQQATPPAPPLPGTVASAAQVFGAAIQAATRGHDEPTVPIDTAGIGATTVPVAIHAPVPAADTQAPLDMRQDRWPSAMIERIDMLRDAANASDTRIRLIPDALGAIDVSVRQDGDAVHVRFAAEQAATRTLLQDAQPRLAELADARGLKLSQSSLDTGAGAGANSSQQQRAATPQQPQAPVRARTQIAAETDSTDTRLA